MTRYILAETQDYDPLNDLFIRNELEFSEDEPVPTDLVKAWDVREEGTGRLIGGAVLALREGQYIIDGIAVEPEFRRGDIGRALLEKAKEEVRRLGGNSIFLVARAPGFFRKQGFDTVEAETAPLFFECATCPQYKVTCHPEIMKLNLE